MQKMQKKKKRKWKRKKKRRMEAGRKWPKLSHGDLKLKSALDMLTSACHLRRSNL